MPASIYIPHKLLRFLEAFLGGLELQRQVVPLVLGPLELPGQLFQLLRELRLLALGLARITVDLVLGLHVLLPLPQQGTNAKWHCNYT